MILHVQLDLNSAQRPYAADKKTAYFLPPVEWTTAALTQLAPAPSVAAVTMGKGAKGTARPSLVRRWEASVAAGQDGTGCAMAARATDGAAVAGGALVAAIKAQWHETAAVELDGRELLLIQRPVLVRVKLVKGCHALLLERWACEVLLQVRRNAGHHIRWHLRRSLWLAVFAELIR